MADTIRLTFDVSPELNAKLDNLKEQLDAASKVEVVRRAVGLYALVLERKKMGERLSILDKDGHAVEIILL